jgi:hypothetical protein
MAVILLPNIRTSISGEGVTPFDEKVEFTLAEKLENTLLISSTNSATVSFSNIDDIISMFFYSTSSFTVNITMTINNTSVTVPIATTGNFRLDPTADFIGTISAITISTTSTTAISVKVCIYGQKLS